MKASNIFMKTLPFCWAKLALGALNVLISAALFAVLFAITMAMESSGMLVISIILWLSLTGLSNFLLNQYAGYLVKAGHIAVISEAVNGGQIPEDQVKYGASKVKARFATANVYFAVDKLVSGAVKQIQNGVEKVGSLFDSIPGISSIVGLLNMFIGIFLGYIDECCLGYTFLRKDQNAFKSAADAVVIYAQSWKTLMKSAAVTMLKVVVIMVVLTVACFIPLAAIFGALEWHLAIAFVLAVMLASVIKTAFVDSYIMCEMMTSYIAVAAKTEVTFDLYGKLCKISRSFKDLFTKGQTNPNPAPAAAVPPTNY